MERKIGEIFTYNGKTYKVVKGNTCEGCAFMKNGHCFSISKLLGLCSYTNRTDKTGVIFKEINNMENNQLTIDIPEGMEIDLEKSNLAKGIVKFKKKDITYEDILQAYTIQYGSLIVSSCHINKLLAVSKLMDIARYYNGDWKPDWNNLNDCKYHIICNNGTYAVDYSYIYIYSNIYFKNKEDAITVINNPNFRDILDKIYKN